MKQVEFLFDFGSPTTYLAWTQLPKIAEEAGAEILYRPMLLGGVFKATGNQTPASVAAKGMHMGVDLRRWAKRYGVPLTMNPHFPINTLPLMRGAVSYQMEGDFETYMTTIYRAMWIAPRNLNEPAEIGAALKEGGFDGEDFMRRIQDQTVKDKLKENTDYAVKKGAFGAPTFFVGEDMFFGQDRLDFVREALA